MAIYRPSELAKLEIFAKKSLSQNFLIDQNIINKICCVAEVQEGDSVIEIGPGPGAITEKLLERGAHVIAIEKDQALASRLEGWGHSRLKVISGDALKFPLDTIPKKSKLVASLPYSITSPLIEKFVTHHEVISSMTLVVQREVGQRMTASKNTKEYGSFSLFLRAYSSPSYCFTIKPTSFTPIPSVHSCIVHLDLHPFPYPFSEESFFKMTRTCFGQRRKMLRTSLKKLYPEVDSTKRPEELSLEEFATLFLELEEDKQNSNENQKETFSLLKTTHPLG